MSGYKRWCRLTRSARAARKFSELAGIAAFSFLIAAVSQGNATAAGESGKQQSIGNEDLAILVAWHTSAIRGYGFMDSRNSNSSDWPPPRARIGKSG